MTLTLSISKHPDKYSVKRLNTQSHTHKHRMLFINLLMDVPAESRTALFSCKARINNNSAPAGRSRDGGIINPVSSAELKDKTV